MENLTTETRGKTTRVLVTGAGGQVGAELASRGKNWNCTVFGLKRSEFDITKQSEIESVLGRIAPDVVVNSAAYTAVDAAETDSQTAFLVNRDAPGFIAAACDKICLPLIHISTDYVFDGSKPGAYREDDPVCPIGVYGRSKEAGETLVRQTARKHIIIRTSWVYAAHGGNFVRTMLRIGRGKDVLHVVDDQYGTPTFAGDIADTILFIANKIALGNKEEYWGTFHYSARGKTTWRDFAKEIFRTVAEKNGPTPRVNCIPSSEYSTPAKRPLNSVLECKKIERVFSVPRRSWKEGLSEVLDHLLED